MPRRFQSGGGYFQSWDRKANGYDYGDSSATATGTSQANSYKSAKSFRSAGARNCCLIVLLIIGALILAIGVGLLVYYLLLSCEYKRILYGIRIILVCGFNPLRNSPWFLRSWERRLLKTMWEKEKMMVASIFSFSHNVF